MADTNNPEVKKNDASGKETQAPTTNTNNKSNTTATVPNNSNSTKPSAPIPTVKIKTPQPEIKYPIGDLIENSKALTGYGKEVAVGALFNFNEKELTKDEFKKTIKDFLGKKVE